MSKTLENKEAKFQQNEEFPDLDFIVLDIRKRLSHDKISSDNPDYEKILDAVIRTTLLKEKFGILKPGQPSEEKQGWFKRIKEELAPSEVAKDWKILSAQRYQLREEKRAGQSYPESDLE
jgi:hypothetical protein